jgi:hypothetical protein
LDQNCSLAHFLPWCLSLHLLSAAPPVNELGMPPTRCCPLWFGFLLWLLFPFLFLAPCVVLLPVLLLLFAAAPAAPACVGVACVASAGAAGVAVEVLMSCSRSY